ncbi:MAG: rhomboid family intramembrane serine protease [Gemmatimonadota bacterium]
MFPLRDDNPTELTPFVTMALIAANFVIWLVVQGGGADPQALQASVCAFGTIPGELTGSAVPPGAGQGLPCVPGGLTWSTLGTSMFFHGSWMHLIGNMWFLWIFGNNIEDSMGHLRYLGFYLLTGAAAALAHIYSGPGSWIPTVGASGAISAVMGAYLLLYPRVRIHTLFIFVIIVRVFPIPAWIILGQWIAIQVLAGATTTAGGAGVAFWAHIGGFVAGLLLVRPFRMRRLVEAKRARVKLRPEEIPHRGWW